MIKAYRGEKALHTHENIGLEDFLERLDDHWGGSSETITVIANALWNGAEIDAVCILPRAIVVIDFKDYGGKIRIAENGPWRGDIGTVRGGSKENPFAQVRDNKRTVMNWLERRNLLNNCNLGHISGTVVFMRPTEIEGDLGGRISSWFRAADLNGCIEWLAELSTEQILVRGEEAAAIVSALGVREYHSLRATQRVVALEGPSAASTPRRKLTERQEEVLEAINAFLGEPARKAITVLGMTQTGKTVLLCETARALNAIGRQAIILAPNARLARYLSEEHGVEFKSFYSHLFERGRRGTEEGDDSATDGEAKGLTYPLQACHDSEDCVYLIDEAHLTSNDPFQLENGKRFGTGRLVEDFVKFASFAESGRQLVVFGDPYHLARGSKGSALISESLLNAQGIPSTTILLEEIHVTSSRESLLDGARRIAEAIKAEDYSTLNLECGNGLSLIAREKLAEVVDEVWETRHGESLIIVDTNREVGIMNGWVRKKLFGSESEAPVASGDLLEIYHRPDTEFDASEAPMRLPIPGDRVWVDRFLGSGVEVLQPLRGRDEAIRLSTLRVETCEQELTILEEYLLAEKPELDAETAIALEVWQKSHQEHPIFLARYAYASTAHRALGKTRPVCIVCADSEGSKQAESYFRWLYTALTRATEHCYLYNFVALDVLHKAKFSVVEGAEGKAIDLGGGWQFGSSLPSSVSDPALLSAERSNLLRQYVAGLLEKVGWGIAKVTSRPGSYQEEYEIAGHGGERAKLSVWYSGINEVTKMQVAAPADGKQLLLAIAEAAADPALEDTLRQRIVEAVRARAKARGLCVVGVKGSGQNRLTVTLRSQNGQIAELQVDYAKRGVVSAIRLMKNKGTEIVDDVRLALDSSGEES